MGTVLTVSTECKMSLNSSAPLSLLGSLEHNYNQVFMELRDRRVDSWFLMASPWPTLISCLLYYYIVRIAGPNFMKERVAYSCRIPMLFYNTFQTFFSLWIFSRLCGFWLGGKYNWICQPVDYSQSEDGLAAASIVWWYFASKFTDFMNSFFLFLNMGVHVVMYFYYLMSSMGPEVQKYLWWK